MYDMPLVKMGCFISMATSNDTNHPASNVIDGDNSTFWMTTGLFPQVFILTFPSHVEIDSVRLSCFGGFFYLLIHNQITTKHKNLI
jgi:heat shock protein beta-11